MEATKLNNYLCKNITDEMFEALVLMYLRDYFNIIGCNTDDNGNKHYTLQDTWVGDNYMLIINLNNSDNYQSFSQEKYMVARKNKETVFLLADYIWEELSRKTSKKKFPNNVKELLSYVKELPLSPSLYFSVRCNYNFADNIKGIVSSKYKEYKIEANESYDIFVEETKQLLIKNGYMASPDDWKKDKIKLTGINGKNTRCECRICLGIGQISFVVKEPFDMLHCRIEDEKDVHILPDKIVKFIKKTLGN